MKNVLIQIIILVNIAGCADIEKTKQHQLKADTYLMYYKAQARAITALAPIAASDKQAAGIATAGIVPAAPEGAVPFKGIAAPASTIAPEAAVSPAFEPPIDDNIDSDIYPNAEVDLTPPACSWIVPGSGATCD